VRFATADAVEDGDRAGPVWCRWPACLPADRRTCTFESTATEVIDASRGFRRAPGADRQCPAVHRRRRGRTGGLRRPGRRWRSHPRRPSRDGAPFAAAGRRRASQELAYTDLPVAGHHRSARATVAEAFLAQAGATGVVAASLQQVSVTVTVTVSTVVLGAFGIGSKSVTATRSAAPFGGGGP
jgi:hypothetical protein